MKPQDWFGVGVRLSGIWCLMQSLGYLLGFFAIQLGYSTSATTTYFSQSPDKSSMYLVYSLGYGAIALWFLLDADRLVGWSYRLPLSAGESSGEDPSDSESGESHHE
jgi:hypothetical protein